MSHVTGSYMPGTQAEQALWSATFYAVVNANNTAYGVADAEMDVFNDLNLAVQATWTAWNANPALRTKSMRIAKDTAFRSMKKSATYLVRKIQGTNTVTDVMKAAAGVTIYKTTITKNPIPTLEPLVTAKADGRKVVVTLSAEVGKKTKPAKVAGAVVLVATGTTPPASLDGWQFSTITTKNTVEIPFPTGPAETVFVTAFWRNSTDESGPASEPIAVNLPAGTALVSETGEDELSLAA